MGLACVAGLSLLLAACGGGSGKDAAAGGEGGLTKLTFLMPAPSVMQFHPWQIAKELGYFTEEGVDVEIVAGDGSSSILQQIISGNADAGLPSPGATMLAASTGRDLVTIYQYEYSNVFTLAASKESGITSVEQLRGKAVGVSDLAGGEVPLVRAALKEAGLEEGVDVTITPVGEGGSLTLNALQEGKIQAYASSLFDEALVTAAGYPMVDILPERLQAFPANSVVTTPKMLKEKGPAMVGMMRAVAKAILFTEINPDAAIAIAGKYAPEEFSDPAVVKSGWAAITKLKTVPAGIADEPRGTFVKDSWTEYMEFLQQGTQEEGALQGPVDLGTLLDSSYLEEINDFDHEAVIKQAEQYPAK
jgi:ABC-type nitrate/sulfonate/bicarbonate transport system substrate-binding protein